MEGFIEKASTSQLVAHNVAIHVWLDPRTDRPKTVGDDFRKIIQHFEGSDCEILWPTVEA